MGHQALFLRFWYDSTKDWTQVSLTQSAGAVEYTNFISVEGWDPNSNEYPDMTLNNLMVSLQ